MKCDFSKINLHYLIQARDIAKEDSEHAAIILGMDKQLSTELAKLSPDVLSMVSRIKVPLIGPHRHTVWWQRFFQALDDGRADEAQAIMEHASLIALDSHYGSNEG